MVMVMVMDVDIVRIVCSAQLSQPGPAQPSPTIHPSFILHLHRRRQTTSRKACLPFPLDFLLVPSGPLLHPPGRANVCQCHACLLSRSWCDL